MSNETHEPEPARDLPLEEKASFYKGTEPFLAVFTQTQVVLSGVRLTFDERIAENLSDLGSQIESARRTFVHSGDVVKALQDIARISATYRQRVQSWETQAQRREQNKVRQSGEKIAKMKAEHSRVRNKAMLGGRALTKLEVEINQLTEAQLQPTSQSDSTENEFAENPENSCEARSARDPKEVARHSAVVRNAFTSLLGETTKVAYRDAEPANQAGSREHVWLGKQCPIAVVCTWTLVTKELPQEFSVDSYSLRRDGAPVSNRNVHVMLIPLSSKSNESFSLVDQALTLSFTSHDLEDYRTDFFVSNRDELEPDLQKGMSARVLRWLEKAEQKLGQLHLLTTQIKNLEFRQNEIIFRISDEEGKSL